MPPRGSIRIRDSSLEEGAKDKPKITSRKRRYRMKKLHGGEPTTSAYVVEKEATSQQPAPVNPLDSGPMRPPQVQPMRPQHALRQNFGEYKRAHVQPVETVNDSQQSSDDSDSDYNEEDQESKN